MLPLAHGRTRYKYRTKLSLSFQLFQTLLALVVLWCFVWIVLAVIWLRQVKPRSLSIPRSKIAFLPLTAYVEPSHLDCVSNETCLLPLRTHEPDKLLKFTYANIQTCDDLPDKLPVFHSPHQDMLYGPNVHNILPLFGARLDYARTTCPVDADPFLPWIHDVFPSDDGAFVEFVAFNKRRCNTDPKVFGPDLNNLEPQVALMQPVPVTRMTEAEVKLLGVPTSLWTSSHEVRYKLATSFENATAKETRFICQFHRLRYNSDDVIEKEVVGETLSVFPYNYELANLRKPGSKPMLTFDENDKHGTHNEQVWNAVLHFSCPVPHALQRVLASGESVIAGSRATLFLDLVPIRTRPRRRKEGYMPQSRSDFNPLAEWGNKHVLPSVESSGRWSHIPLCLPPKRSSLRRQPANSQANKLTKMTEALPKDHFLVGCIWASAMFSTRGDGNSDTSTSARLLEWLTYHLDIAGFDHMFVYDNTGPNARSLEPITQLFARKVTRIPWPHRVCNNNQAGSPNPGERSSQYAAEASCRIRHGHNTEWMIFFDTDEYLIPQGNWKSIKHWLEEGVGKESESHILSFYQSRAVPNVDFMQSDSSGRLAKRANVTFLAAYDCESGPLPKANDKWRAMKQVYRPWYVLNHFVHYSTVTNRILDHPEQVSPMFIERSPYERRVDEINEAFMLHTKTTPLESTKRWKLKCHVNARKNTCPVGIAFPFNNSDVNANKDGMRYNCYRHERVQRLVPGLERAILSRIHNTT